MVASALIGVGGSLLSGIFGSNSARKAQDRQNWYNHPTQVRARAEEAGFNPLLFVGPGVGNQAAPAASGHMGAAIADSSMMLANDMQARSAEAKRLQDLETQNKKLLTDLQQATLRPLTAGLYGPDVRGMGRGVITSPSPVVASGIGSVKEANADLHNSLMKGETPEVEPAKSEAFLKEARLGGDTYLVPAEPDLDELVVNLGFMAPQYGRHAARAFEDRMHRSARGKLTIAEKQADRQKASRGVYNMTFPGIIDRVQGAIGFQHRPLNFFGKSK